MSLVILVIGATGKTGRRLVRHLRAAGHGVRPAGRSAMDGLVPFDWANESTFDAVLQGMKAVYLMPPAMVEDASDRMASFLARAGKSGVEHVVFLSSLGISFPGEPAMSGRHKHEEAVRASGLSWTILRPSGFFQNFSEGFLLPAIRNHDAIASTARNGAAAMIDAGDIAAVAAAALTGKNWTHATLALTGPDALTMADIAVILSAAAGRKIEYRPVPPEGMEAMLAEAGMPAAYADMLLRDMTAIRDGHAAEVTNAVEQVTGRKPRSFEAFAEAAAGIWAKA